jgi:IS30 family transposase
MAAVTRPLVGSSLRQEKEAAPSCCQMAAAERYTLALLRRRGLPPAAIAVLLGRHRSTIGRELGRNCTAHDGRYRPQLADCG